MLAALLTAVATNVTSVAELLDSLGWPHLSTPISQATLIFVGMAGAWLITAVSAVSEPDGGVARSALYWALFGVAAIVAELTLFLSAGRVGKELDSDYTFTETYGATAWVAESNLVVLIFTASVGIWITRQAFKNATWATPAGHGLIVLVAGICVLTVVAVVRMGAIVATRYVGASSFATILSINSLLSAVGLLLVSAGTLWASGISWRTTIRTLREIGPLRDRMTTLLPELETLHPHLPAARADVRLAASLALINDGLDLLSGSRDLTTHTPAFVGRWLAEQPAPTDHVETPTRVAAPNDWIIAVAREFRASQELKPC